MIGLDTNVVVRLFIDDEHSERARALVSSRCSPDEPGFIDRVALCEAVWVLTAGYGYDRAKVAGVIGDLLLSDDMLVEDAPLAEAALAEYRRRGVDFADLMIAEANHAHGCEATATFDRRAARSSRFVRVP